MLRKGEPAPDIELPDQDGEPIALSTLWKEAVLVLFFYPRDHTLGCTQEACAFRDGYSELREAGAEVIGISSDDKKSHRRFREEHSLPYRLLSDEEGKARKAFGIKKSMGVMPSRVTFVIDREGVVRSVLNSQFQFRKHFRRALRVVGELQDQGQ